jgi:hypothetical protein
MTPEEHLNDMESGDEDGEDGEESRDEWNGSGIWEKTENRRWIAVANHIIPRIDPSAPDSSLVSGLGIGQYVENFESETQVAFNNSKLVTSGSMVVRISVELEPPVLASIPEQTEDLDESEPVAGPSGCSHKVGKNDPSNSSTVDSSTEQIISPEPRSKKPRSSFVRNKRKQRKRNRCKSKKLFPPLSKRSASRVPSAASSPGRATPSPDSLARICLYWEHRLNSPEYIIHSDSE